jgi:Cys-tRNA(Pro)/Cys-tRNA(Cys) deacylase
VEDRIAAYLTARGVPFRVHAHDPVITEAEAREKLPFPPEQALKAVAFLLTDGRWVLVGMRGVDRADFKKLAAALNVRRGDLRLPAPQQVETELGFRIGGVCPIPLDDRTLVVLDRALLTIGTGFTGMGGPERTLEIAVDDLIAATNATVADVTQDARPPSQSPL